MFALYLIDIADVIQQEEIVQAYTDIVQKHDRSFNPMQFYKIVCVFIQLYRSCFISYIHEKSEELQAKGGQTMQKP